MKYIFILLACAVFAAGCGNRNKKAAPAAEIHVHTDGSECSGDHDDSHAGHDHDHESATAHSHAEGEACKDHDHEHSDDPHAGHDHAGGGSEGDFADEIIFPVSQAKKTDFEVQTVETGTFSDIIKAAGQILPAQGDEVTLAATSNGIVSFANARIAEGSSVGRGQPLFYISSRNIASGDILVKNKSVYDNAKSELERAEKLLADRIISQREYDNAKLVFEQAKVEYSALAGSQSARGAGVATPIGGYVTSLGVKEGDYVETGQILGSVSQNRNLVLRAELSQRYLSRLKGIVGANFTLPYDGTTYELSSLNGRLLSISRNSTAGTTLVPVTFEFANNGVVIPGTYVDVYLLGALQKDVVSLPVTAITEQQGLYYVYVQIDDEGYQRREVKIAQSDGVRVKILSGVCPGERVVTRGAVNVKMAAASGSIPHGHEH